MSVIRPEDLTTLTVVENDSGLVKYTINSIKKFTPITPKIIIAHNNNSSAAVLTPFKNDPGVLIVPNKINPGVKNTSTRHGLGLNAIMPLVQTPYTAIVESDVILTSDKWWQLDDSYDLKACQKAGCDPDYSPKDVNYWFMCFLVFKTKLFKDINWCPSPQRPQGPVHPYIYNDSGWEMASAVSKHHALIKSLEYVKCKVGGKQRIFDDSFSYKSFELWEDSEPICAHFYRGSDIQRRPNPSGDLKRWSSICDGILR